MTDIAPGILKAIDSLDDPLATQPDMTPEATAEPIPSPSEAKVPDWWVFLLIGAAAIFAMIMAAKTD